MTARAGQDTAWRGPRLTKVKSEEIRKEDLRVLRQAGRVWKTAQIVLVESQSYLSTRAQCESEKYLVEIKY